MVVVKVSEGLLEGQVVNSDYEEKYYSFKGIPYAEPPLGDLRFKAPLLKKTWDGIHKAHDFGPKCYQIDALTKLPVDGSEDCLYLNVYTPNITPKYLLPVMFWIHGGGFVWGSGNDDYYGPEFLIRHNVILVTFNYRLEILGFLCLDTEDIPGNAGMKDQVAALRWVKRNISNFGGDPSNITIFGESVGAASVSFHLLSPMSKGLFKRAIMQSGCCSCWWAICNYARERALVLAKDMGCKSNDDKEIYEFFKSQPLDNLIAKRIPVTFVEETKKCLNIYFGVVSEKKFENSEAFFEGDVYEALRAGIHEGVEVINGYNEDEGILQLIENQGNNEMFEQANKFLEFFVPQPVGANCTEADQLEVAKKLKTFYFGNNDVSNKTLNELVRYFSMDWFFYGAILWHKICANNNKNKSYLYRFGCKSERNIDYFYKRSEVFDRPLVGHGDDLPYIFPMKIGNQKIDINSTTFQMIDQVCRLWTNFAKFGDPTPDDSLGERWIPYSLEYQNYLDIGQQLTNRTFAEKEEIDFWESILREHCPWLVETPN